MKNKINDFNSSSSEILSTSESLNDEHLNPSLLIDTYLFIINLLALALIDQH